MGWDLSQLDDGVGIAAADVGSDLRQTASDALWERSIADRSDAVADAVTGSVEAGAEVVIAFTDRLNRITLSELAAEASDNVDAMLKWNEAIVSKCRQSAASSERKALAFCALGPVDRLWMLEEIAEAELMAAYAEQVRLCIEGGAEGFICRSFSEVETLRIAVRAVRAACDLPVIGSMTFDAGPDAMATTTGTSIPEACRVLQEAGADMVGVDRTEFPDGTAAIVSLLVETAKLPVYAEVNAGRAEVREHRVVYPEPAATYGERLERLRDAGVRVVGAGLGTGRDHIAQLAKQRERLVRKARRGNARD